MKTVRALLVVFASLCMSPTLAAPEAGDTVVRQGTLKEDLYLAGRSVDMLAQVEGDVVIAGGQLTIDNQVSGDVLAAGGNVVVRARVGDDVRVVGGNVTIGGAVGDDAIAAGGTILLAPTAAVGGNAWLAGGTVTITGKVAKALRVAATRVVISGEVAGDVELYAEDVEINRGATIGGNLTYYSKNDARISSDAKIKGAVRRQPPSADEEARQRGVAGSIAQGVFNIGLILAGIVAFLLFPVASVGAAKTIGESPWKSLGLGFALLAATPLVIALLFATLFGIWLALLALLVYFLLLFVGFLTGVFYIGETILNVLGRRAEITTTARILAIIAAFVVLWAIRFTPVLGGVVVFALMLFGMGALALYLARRYVRET